MKKIFIVLIDSGPIVMLALISFAGSFAHIRQTAIDHGQSGWMATGVAICLDLASLSAARERQRDRKAGRKAGWPTTVLLGAVGLSLAANLDQAQPTAWGWIVAGTPCGAFVAAVALMERRGAHRASQGVEDAPEPPALHASSEPPRCPPEPEPATRTTSRPPHPQVSDDLLLRARQVADAHQEQEGKPISRDVLRKTMKVSTSTASALMKELKTAAA